MSGIRRRAVYARIVRDFQRLKNSCEVASRMFAVNREPLRQALKERDEARQELMATQAALDRVMLEHCPDEMTEEQLDRWAAAQRLAVVAQPSAGVLPAELEIPAALPADQDLDAHALGDGT